MNWVNQIARFIVGVLFIISGLIKLNDPVGTAIKFQEYFEVFATDIGEFFHLLVPYSLYFSIGMSVLEVVLGVAVLIYFRMQLTTWILLLMILFFTFLTFYSAYFNKVTDCGCFGDAIKLTPWQSFYKDIVLVILIGILFLNRHNFIASFGKRMSKILLGIVLAASFIFAIQAVRHLPPIDFRAYKIGNNLPQLMQPSEELRYKYIMEKGGESFEFDQYPTEGDYKYKDMILVNPEAQPKITDYNVWNDEGDFTDYTFSGNKLIIISYDVNKADVDSFQDINALVNAVSSDKVEVITLTASDEGTFEDFRHHVQLATPYYFADGTVLKTIVRANPGLVLLQNGVVKGKWHYNDVPDQEEIQGLLTN